MGRNARKRISYGPSLARYPLHHHTSTTTTAAAITVAPSHPH
jgi:hypothetical protein